MSCAVGVSRRELLAIHEYAQRFGKLVYLEAIFNTVAAHANLTILTPYTLRTIVYRKEWTCQEIVEQPLNWFHPIKEQAKFIGECVLKGNWKLAGLLDRDHIYL